MRTPYVLWVLRTHRQSGGMKSTVDGIVLHNKKHWIKIWKKKNKTKQDNAQRTLENCHHCPNKNPKNRIEMFKKATNVSIINCQTNKWSSDVDEKLTIRWCKMRASNISFYLQSIHIFFYIYFAIMMFFRPSVGKRNERGKKVVAKNKFSEVKHLDWVQNHLRIVSILMTEIHQIETHWRICVCLQLQCRRCRRLRYVEMFFYVEKF